MEQSLKQHLTTCFGESVKSQEPNYKALYEIEKQERIIWQELYYSATKIAEEALRLRASHEPKPNTK